MPPAGITIVGVKAQGFYSKKLRTTPWDFGPPAIPS
jgi:hypothetical protein